MAKTTTVATLYLTSLLLVALFLGLTGDDLLFHSDLISLAYLISSLSLLTFLVLCALALVASLVLRARMHAFLEEAEHIPLVLLLSGLLVFGFEAMAFEIQDPWWLLCALVLVLLAAGLSVPRLPNIAEARRRQASLARVAAVAGVTTFAGCFAFMHLPHTTVASASAGTPKHAILIVIDGMPTQFLKTYQPTAPETEFDRAMKQGLVFRNARTNKVYTSGYFGVLYSGRKDLGTRPTQTNEPMTNLLGLLQKRGVSTRWISFHPNGIPESNGIVEYEGLRSAFLTENWTWFPSLLGMNYHTFIAWQDSRGNRNPRIRALFRALNSTMDEDELWEEHIPRQIDELHGGTTPSFLLVHVSYTKHVVQTAAENPREAPAIVEFYKRARQNEYRFREEDEPIVNALRQKYHARANEYGLRIKRVLEYLQDSGRSANTLVIVTADHGTILSKNKIWYGKHIDEEVTRVPLVLFGSGRSGTNQRLVDTTDLTETIVDHFGIHTSISDDGVSLFSSEQKTSVSVLTTSSAKRGERFVGLYRGREKFVLNIDTRGGGENWWGSVSGYEVVKAPSPIPPGHPVWYQLRGTLRGFGLRPNDLHARYQRVLRIPPPRHAQAQ